MFAILHAFVLWHKEWAGGRLRLACDNSTVVQDSKRSGTNPSEGNPSNRYRQSSSLQPSLTLRSPYSGYPWKRTLWRMPRHVMISRSWLTLGFRPPQSTVRKTRKCRPCARSYSPS
jgi:hypothetical protein